MDAWKGFGAPLVIAALLLLALPAVGSAAVLYDQTDSPSGTGILSQNDGPQNVQAADDFTVPPGQPWKVESVDVVGAYDLGAGPITSANVFLYSDNGALPGTELFAGQNVAPLNGTAGPDFSVPLTGAPQLAQGSYWVSVQVNIPAGNIWDWQTRSTQSGNPRAFIDHSGALCGGVWAHVGAGCPIGPVPDQLFRLNGTVVPATTPPAAIPQQTTKKCKKKKKKHRSAESAKKKKCKKKKGK
jgi:hypothetical protein